MLLSQQYFRLSMLTVFGMCSLFACYWVLIGMHPAYAIDDRSNWQCIAHGKSADVFAERKAYRSECSHSLYVHLAVLNKTNEPMATETPMVSGFTLNTNCNQGIGIDDWPESSFFPARGPERLEEKQRIDLLNKFRNHQLDSIAPKKWRDYYVSTGNISWAELEQQIKETEHPCLSCTLAGACSVISADGDRAELITLEKSVRDQVGIAVQNRKICFSKIPVGSKISSGPCGSYMGPGYHPQTPATDKGGEWKILKRDSLAELAVEKKAYQYGTRSSDFDPTDKERDLFDSIFLHVRLKNLGTKPLGVSDKSDFFYPLSWRLCDSQQYEPGEGSTIELKDTESTFDGQANISQFRKRKLRVIEPGGTLSYWVPYTGGFSRRSIFAKPTKKFLLMTFAGSCCLTDGDKNDFLSLTFDDGKTFQQADVPISFSTPQATLDLKTNPLILMGTLQSSKRLAATWCRDDSEKQCAKEVEECKSTETSASADDLHRCARVFLRERQYNKALDYCNRAIAKFSTMQNYYLTRGRIYNGLHKYENAIADFKRVYDIRYLAESYFGLRDYNAALDACDKAINSAPGYNEYGPCRFIYSLRGRVHMALGQYQQAVGDFTNGLAITGREFDGNDFACEWQQMQMIASMRIDRATCYAKLGSISLAEADRNEASVIAK